MTTTPLRALAGSLLAAAFVTHAFAPDAVAQAESSIRARSRVERIFKKVLKTPSVAVKQTLQRAASKNVRMNGKVKKPAPEIMRYTRVGDLELWQRSGMKLARKGARWAQPGVDDAWAVQRKPEGLTWSRSQLADPLWLAERLMVHSAKIAWKMEQTGELDSRPVRKYTCSIDGAVAQALGRSGAVPYPVNNNTLGLVLLLAGRARAPKPKSPDARYEIDVLEDPRSRLPARIVVRMFSKSAGAAFAAAGGAAVFIQQVGANAKKDDDDEEEDEDDQKEKPVVTATLDFSNWGDAEIDDLLPQEAIQALTLPALMQKKAPEASKDEAGEKKRGDQR